MVAYKNMSVPPSRLIRRRRVGVIACEMKVHNHNHNKYANNYSVIFLTILSFHELRFIDLLVVGMSLLLFRERLGCMRTISGIILAR